MADMGRRQPAANESLHSFPLKATFLAYSTQGNPLFPTLGKDYGNPRSGYDPFNLLFLAMQEQRERVTSRICWTDAGNHQKVCQ